MGLFKAIFGGGVTDAVGAVGNVVDQIFTSDEERAKAQEVMEKIRQHPHLLQAEINKVEASHRSLFVAGWRPFIGWVCGVGLLWAFLGHGIFEWIVVLSGREIEAPEIGTEHLMELVLALLGLGGLRTFEKFTGKAK